ncbi:MAG: hypothetical protein KAW09_11190 [Thermoplasmata archaeon]|nr:hypothetical protein [Thermoplasmata archaeon]
MTRKNRRKTDTHRLGEVNNEVSQESSQKRGIQMLREIYDKYGRIELDAKKIDEEDIIETFKDGKPKTIPEIREIMKIEVTRQNIDYHINRKKPNLVEKGLLKVASSQTISIDKPKKKLSRSNVRIIRTYEPTAKGKRKAEGF